MDSAAVLELCRILIKEADDMAKENNGYDGSAVQLLNEIEAMPLGRVIPHPSVDELMIEIDPLLGNLRHTLFMRGNQYGEEVLAVMGEQGIAELVNVKIWRVLGSLKSSDPACVRQDSWLDLAGYAILALAMQRWERKQEKE